MLAVESFMVSFLTVGEGWHNYHHAFPWDYRAAEYGTSFSFTTFIIDVLARFGMAYDLKTTPDDMIQRRVLRSGDGSHKYCYEDEHHPATDINDNIVEDKNKTNGCIANGDGKLDKLIENSKAVMANGKIYTNGTAVNGKIKQDCDKDK